MKTLVHLFILFLLTTQTGIAQKGFESKRKTATAHGKPSFVFEAVPIPQNTTAGKKKISGISGRGIRSSIQQIKLVKDQKGSVIWLENSRFKAQKISGNSRTNASLAAFGFLNDVKSNLPFKKPEDNFEVSDVSTDDQNQTHIRLKQVYKNIPVYGGEILLHTVHDNLQIMNGRYFPEPTLDHVVPSLDKIKAEQLALSDVASHAIVNKPSDVLAKRFCQPRHELVVYYQDENTADAHLAWHVTIHPNLIERWEYFLDADNGKVLAKYNHTCGVDGPVTSTSKDLNNVQRTFGTYQVGSLLYMIDTSKPMFKNDIASIPNDPVGALWTIDASNTSGKDLKIKNITSSNANSWNATAVSAHQNAGVSYQYYLNTFKRNSLNGKDGTIISIINISDEDDGKGLDNAFWNGEFMGYGNGRNAFKPLAGALDVAGHEMTHGVIQNSANLEYQGQSGAINESMADVFGVLIDRDDWTVGEDIVKTSVFPSGALRSMSNPNQGGKGQNGYQPKTMAQFDKTTEDNGGVHTNSGIPNYAFFLIASKIGREKSEQIYYRALTQYLTRRSQFVDLRLAIVQSATDFFGAESDEVAKAKEAFDAVGIVTGNSDPDPDDTDLPVNNGSDGLLVMGSNDNSLYQTTPDASKFIERSKQGTGHKPSVTDDGKFAYFVSDDKRIRAITLTGTAQEQVVSKDAIWDNVAISRDGKKLAAVTSDKNNTVYVYSFDQGEWKKFTLYNPTYSDGVTTGEVQYADAIVWDLSGENLVYDANNKISSVDGESHEYWDVGFMKVWDNTANNFGDGTIDKLFTNLDEGENIGNPAYSKNGPNIMAFDYFYEPDDSYSVIGVDINKGDVEMIYENNTLGFPDYSRKDDQMVFNTESDGNENVGIIDLAPNHISASGDASVLFENRKWAVWYGQGSRETSKQAQTIQFAQLSDKVIGDAPFTLSATASSSLSVSFEKVSGGVTIQEKQVTLVKAGKATVRAAQEGNDKFNPASTVSRTFCINPTRPTVKGSGKDYTATSTGADEYIWYEDGEEVFRHPSGSVTISQEGTYEVRAVTSDGCLSTASSFVTNVVLGNEPLPAVTGAPYPNPAKTELTIEGNWNQKPTAISFIDAAGRSIPVHNSLVNGNKLIIPITNMNTGLYILKINSGKKDLVYKVVKE